jgi:hypothetical protein
MWHRPALPVDAHAKACALAAAMSAVTEPSRKILPPPKEWRCGLVISPEQ